MNTRFLPTKPSEKFLKSRIFSTLQEIVLYQARDVISGRDNPSDELLALYAKLEWWVNEEIVAAIFSDPKKP